MKVFFKQIWLFSIGSLLSLSVLLGCGDQVQDVSVSVKTASKDGAPLRYVQFTLNDKGMITNKDGVKKTTMKLKNGDSVKFDLVRLPDGFVLSDPGQRSAWTTAFNGDSGQPIVFNIVLKPEGEVVATVALTPDAGVEKAVVDADVVEVVAQAKVPRVARRAKRTVRTEKPKSSRVEPDDTIIAPAPREIAREPEPVDDGTIDLPPLPSKPAARFEAEPPPPLPEPMRASDPVAKADQREELDDPLTGLEGIDDDPMPEPVAMNDIRNTEAPSSILEPLPVAEAVIAPPVAEELPEGLILDDAPSRGGVTDGASLTRIRAKLDNGGALSAGEIGDLESTPKVPKREFVESRRLLADWYYQNRQWRKQAGALKIATETRGPYRRDPMVLLSLAKAYGHLKSYRQASKVMSNVERYGNRLPKEKRADAYRFYAEMLEFQFLQQQRDDPEKANLELINQAISKLRKLITFVGGASPKAKRYAEQRLVKLEELKRRVAE
jgi:hypothetical protein